MTTTNLLVPMETHEPNSLFLREAWMSGKAPDGTKIELTRTVGGGGLIFDHTTPEGVHTVHSINVAALVQLWADAIDSPTTEPEPETVGGEDWADYKAAEVATHFGTQVDPRPIIAAALRDAYARGYGVAAVKS